MLDPFKTDLEQSRQMLRHFAMARALIISIVAAYCAIVEFGSGSYDHNTAYLFVVLAVALIESFVALAIITAGHKPDMRFSFFLLCADLVQNTAIVLMTGGNESVFVFLYIAIILSASLIYSFRLTLVTATACSLFFLATVILQFSGYVLPVSPFLREAQVEASLLPDAIMKIFAFYLSAFLGGLLSERVGLLRLFHENVMNCLSSGYISINGNEMVTFLNPTGSNLLKRTKAEAIGKNISSIFPVAEGRRNPLSEAISKRIQINSREILVVRGDGKTIPVGITVSPILSRTKSLLGAVGNFIDLTEIKRMEEKLRRADRLAAVGEVSSTLAHEIRNPVASIRAAVQELSENTGLETATNKQLMSIAVRECDQLGKLVSNFLEFVACSGCNYERFNVAELLDEVVEAAQRMFFNGSGRIQKDFSSALGLIIGDRTRLKEALLKIIQNRSETMPDEGIIRISATGENQGRATISIIVEDDGKGIPHEELSSSYTPFYFTKPGGTGLWLAIAHKIISSHDGTIDVDSTADMGTRVRIVLPRQEDDGNG